MIFLWLRNSVLILMFITEWFIFKKIFAYL